MNIWGQNEGTGLFSYDRTIPDLEKRARSFPIPDKVRDLPFFRAIEIKIVDESGKEMKEPGSVESCATEAHLRCMLLPPA